VNFLQICQAVHEELGLDGAQTLPTAVTAQTGRLAQIVNWVKRTNSEIQAKHKEWKFRRSSGIVTLTAGQSSVARSAIVAANSTYDDLAPFFRGDQRFVNIYQSALGKADTQSVWYVEYEQFRGWLDRQPFPTGRPGRYSVRPDGALLFDALADVNYVVEFDFVRSIQDLAANGDVPIIPADYHDAIVYGACMKYGGHTENAVVFGDFNRRFRQRMTQLSNRELPEINWSPYPLW